MRTELVVVPSPAFYFVSGVLQRHKPVHVQLLIPETSIEGFDIRTVCRRTEERVIKLDFIELHQGVQRTGDELGLVIYLDSLR